MNRTAIIPLVAVLLATFAPISDARSLPRPPAREPVRKIGSVPSKAGDISLNQTNTPIRVAAEEVYYEGSVTHSISGPFGSGSFTVVYSRDGKPGPEDDNIFEAIPTPSGTYAKMTTFVEGVEVSGMTVPAGDSPGSGECPSITVYIGAGYKYIVPEGSVWHATASVNGFDQIDHAGGHWTYKTTDAEGEMPTGTYVGPTSFSFGGSASIEWIYIPGNTEPNNPPVNPNDPNSTNVTPTFKPPVNLNTKWGKEDPVLFGGMQMFPPDKTLFIDNLWEGCDPNSNVSSWALTLIPGSDEYFSQNDGRYARPLAANKDISSMVTSMLVRKNGNTLMGTIDARAVLPEKLKIYLAFDSADGNAVYFDPAKPKRNHLSLSYPVLYGNDSKVKRPFDEQIISIGYDDPNSPRWDVDRLVKEFNGVFELPPLKGNYAAKAAYATFVLYSDFPLTDVDLSGRTDSNDVNFVKSMLGFKGSTPADVWGPLGLGMPDGIVDANDVKAVEDASIHSYSPQALTPGDAPEWRFLKPHSVSSIRHESL